MSAAQVSTNAFGAQTSLKTRGGSVEIFRLAKLAEDGIASIDRLPFSIKVLLESALRNVDDFQVRRDDVVGLARWNAKAPAAIEIPFKPGRVILQDFTGVPSMVDLAALRSAMKRLGGDPKRINPQVPCDLVIDHSVQVDVFGRPDALELNQKLEFERNRERYEFLKWGQQAFDNFRVVPPATGIVHQVNLEYLADVVLTKKLNGGRVALPDSLVGTDSHTTMINSLGVVGWGVGGIEAEAIMLGQPIYMLTPEVIGFKLNGKLPEGATATDLVLTITQMLRARGVVGKFVEFYGPGLAEMSLPDRAVVSNMCPEYGATIALFPVDPQTIAYLKLTGRSEDLIDLVERYTKEQGLFRQFEDPDPEFTETMELDLSHVEPSLAGPKRPQDRVRLGDMGKAFKAALSGPVSARGFAVTAAETAKKVPVKGADSAEIGHGAVVIAAITSCTNTSNPSVMLGAGLLAKKAVERGLKVKPWVKTSLAPGSRVVTDYYAKAGLTGALEALGFHTVGYGCTTCIGNSGPLPDPVVDAINQGNLVAASVLSGNRNFEGRINPHVKANYLASPPLVVAYALAGTVDIDLTSEPIGTDSKGQKVYLREIWPTQAEIDETIRQSVSAEQFRQQYSHVFQGDTQWQSIPIGATALYEWKADSTYIQEPPFFVDMTRDPQPLHPIRDARCLAMLGDSVTTDHISPAGSIKADSPAGKYLQSLGVTPKDFNSYGARRGNDRVMTRGTFANIRLRNLLAPGTEGGVTTYFPSAQVMSIYDAAMNYRADNTPLVILAGKEYGTGSSRDWAAKGTALLGVRVVIAESFERIHRSNLVGMGILPLQFKQGDTPQTLGLTGREFFSVEGLDESLKPFKDVTVVARNESGKEIRFPATCRIDTPVEIEYYRNGGILQTVIRNMLKS